MHNFLLVSDVFTVLHTPVFTSKSFFLFLFCFGELILSVISYKKRIVQIVFLKIKGNVLR